LLRTWEYPGQVSRHPAGSCLGARRQPS
jgi:hypothetical protein